MDDNNVVPRLPLVAATDDEKSGMDIANPDSFLGSSLTNFDKAGQLKV